MRFFATVAFLSSLFAFAAANQSLEALFEEKKLADAGVAAPVVEARDASAENLPVLEERQSKKCPKSNGCTCKKVKQGQYCGACQQVLTYGSGGSILHIFECNKDGGCCDYGPSDRCESSYEAAVKWCPRP